MNKGNSKIYSYTKEELQNLLDNSNGYSDVLRKMGLNPKGGNPETLKRIIEEYGLSMLKLNENRHNLFSENGKRASENNRIPLSNLLHKGVEYSSSDLLHRLYKEGLKEPKCERCNITTWEGEQISFHLHHKDGDRLNNELNNLQVLCPNCHSLTDNFAGRAAKKRYYCADCGAEILKSSVRCVSCDKKRSMQKSKRNMITRDELKDLIRTTPFTTIAKQFNVSDNAIRKWCKKYDLPYQSSVIKSYSDDEWEKI